MWDCLSYAGTILSRHIISYKLNSRYFCIICIVNKCILSKIKNIIICPQLWYLKVWQLQLYLYVSTTNNIQQPWWSKKVLTEYRSHNLIIIIQPRLKLNQLKMFCIFALCILFHNNSLKYTIAAQKVLHVNITSVFLLYITFTLLCVNQNKKYKLPCHSNLLPILKTLFEKRESACCWELYCKVLWNMLPILTFHTVHSDSTLLPPSLWSCTSNYFSIHQSVNLLQNYMKIHKHYMNKSIKTEQYICLAISFKQNS